jgi:hypothetical protein
MGQNVYTVDVSKLPKNPEEARKYATNPKNMKKLDNIHKRIPLKNPKNLQKTPKTPKTSKTSKTPKTLKKSQKDIYNKVMTIYGPPIPIEEQIPSAPPLSIL